MSGAENGSSSSSEREERRSTPEVVVSGCEKRFFESLREFIEHEKQFLRCPAGGPDELRYIIYRCAFNKVVARATSYKRLLSTIKSEYDGVIRALKHGSGAVRAAHASTSRHKSLISCQRRAAHLRDRISALQKETAELREEIRRNKVFEEQSTWIPGLSVAESKDPVALDAHLKRLQARKAALLDTRSRRVPPEVEAELEAELRAAERRRELKKAENTRLKLLFQRLRLVSGRLSEWEEEEGAGEGEGEGAGLLDDLLVSTLEDIRQLNVTEAESRRIEAELFQEPEPTGADESKRLTEHLERFLAVFNLGHYEEAALLAARSPRGVLRNLDVMEMFEGVRGVPGSRPPLLLFFHSLLLTAPAGEQLSSRLSLQLARCVLRHGALQLVAHAVTLRKLALSEELGDALSQHALTDTGAADSCLALATVVYEACGLHRKTALSLSRRGLNHSAAQLISRHQELTAEDCMWVLCRSPSLALLQLLTEPQQARAAILPVGVACETLLAGSEQQQRPALQLLDGFVSRGVLKEAILQDGGGGSRVDVWASVACLCCGSGRADLSRDVDSVLLSSPDLDGVRLMEHVFL